MQRQMVSRASDALFGDPGWQIPMTREELQEQAWGWHLFGVTVQAPVWLAAASLQGCSTNHTKVRYKQQMAHEWLPPRCKPCSLLLQLNSAQAVSPSSSMCTSLPVCTEQHHDPLFCRRHLPLPAVPPAWLPTGGGGDTDVPSEHITPGDVYGEADFIRGCANTLEVISFNQQRSGFCGLLLSSLLTIPEKRGLLCSGTDGKVMSAVPSPGLLSVPLGHCKAKPVRAHPLLPGCSRCHQMEHLLTKELICRQVSRDQKHGSK